MGELSDELYACEADMRRVGNLILTGRLPEAEAVLDRVVARFPDDPEPIFALGVIYLNTGRLTDAAGTFRDAIRLDPEFAEAHCNLGTTLSATGRRSEAIDAFRRAINLDPQLADAHARMADILSDQGHRHAAIESFRRVIEVAPHAPIALLAEAKILLLREVQLGKAEGLLRRYISMMPEGGAIGGCQLLASVLAQQGRFDEAIACYDKALAIAPDDAELWYGRVSVTRLTDRDRPLVERMQTLLANTVADAPSMALHFALGKAHDDLGDYAGAIRHFDAANAIRRGGNAMNRGALVAWVDHLRARCTKGYFERSAAFGRLDETPVLIVGMPRSGTTLVEQILSSHPEVVGAGEQDFWRQHSAEWMTAGPNGFRPERTAELADGYLALLRGIGPLARRVCDKNPWNFEHIGMIHQALPNARIIHCRRNPVDTCLSVYFTKFLIPQAFMSHRADLAHYFRQYTRLTEHWRNVLPADRYMEIQYEDVVGDREAAARRLIDFCALDWDDACLRHQDNKRPIRTASFWQVRQPVYRSSLERWRHYEPWLGELRPLLDLAWEPLTAARRSSAPGCLRPDANRPPERRKSA